MSNTKNLIKLFAQATTVAARLYLIEINGHDRIQFNLGGCFVYRDVSSNSDLNQLLFILRTDGVFM